MTEHPAPARYTAFDGDRRIGHGALAEVARAAHGVALTGSLLVFDDATGRIVDLDLRGSADEAVARVTHAAQPARPARGRPKLGVTAREVTLLPRHWDWLALQPGGASATLRRLVDEARRDAGGADAQRAARDALYRVVTTLAGNRSGYEEAVRALFADDRSRFTAFAKTWPKDIWAYLDGFAAFSPASPGRTHPPAA